MLFVFWVEDVTRAKLSKPVGWTRQSQQAISRTELGYKNSQLEEYKQPQQSPPLTCCGTEMQHRSWSIPATIPPPPLLTAANAPSADTSFHSILVQPVGPQVILPQFSWIWPFQRQNHRCKFFCCSVYANRPFPNLDTRIHGHPERVSSTLVHTGWHS